MFAIAAYWTASPVPSLEPMDRIIAEDPMDQITLLDIDENGNTYFDLPHIWDPLFGQSQTNDRTDPISAHNDRSPATDNNRQ
jgi:hypothetical protein